MRIPFFCKIFRVLDHEIWLSTRFISIRGKVKSHPEVEWLGWNLYIYEIPGRENMYILDIYSRDIMKYLFCLLSLCTMISALTYAFWCNS